MRSEVESNATGRSVSGPSNATTSVPPTPQPEDDQSEWSRQEQQVSSYGECYIKSVSSELSQVCFRNNNLCTTKYSFARELGSPIWSDRLPCRLWLEMTLSLFH